MPSTSWHQVPFLFHFKSQCCCVWKRSRSSSCSIRVNEKLFFCRASPSNRASSQNNQVIIRGTDGAVAEPRFFDPFEVLSPHHVPPHHEKCLHKRRNRHAEHIRRTHRTHESYKSWCLRTRASFLCSAFLFRVHEWGQLFYVNGGSVVFGATLKQVLHLPPKHHFWGVKLSPLHKVSREVLSAKSSYRRQIFLPRAYWKQALYCALKNNWGYATKEIHEYGNDVDHLQGLDYYRAPFLLRCLEGATTINNRTVDTRTCLRGCTHIRMMHVSRWWRVNARVVAPADTFLHPNPPACLLPSAAIQQLRQHQRVKIRKNGKAKRRYIMTTQSMLFHLLQGRSE